MKKILSLVLVLALALSFTLTSFAETYIHKSYMDTETGIIYHYGSFEDGDTDAGVMINGKKYSLKNGIYMGEGRNAFEKSSTREDSLKNKFMIGLKAHDSVTDTYQITPYAESENGIVTSNPITVFKNAYEAPLLTKTVNAITDDIAMISNGVSATGTYTTVKTDGLYGGMEDGKNPAQLYITMMKIDLSKFSDAAEGSNFILNVSGYVGDPAGVCNIDKIKVKAYGIPSEAFAESETYWSESDYSSLGGHANWYESYIYGKPASDVLRLSLDDSENIYHKLNITGYIQSELAKKSSYATIALVADNKEASENAVEDDPETSDNEAVRNVMRFYCYTKESSTPPYVEYQYGDKTVELNEIKIGESFINLDMLDSENTYYKYLPAGTTEFPQVTATANDLAVVQVTQATEDTKEAVITLTHSYYSDVTKTYKVKFVETDRTYSLKGKITKGYIAAINKTDNSVSTVINTIEARDIYGTRAGYEPRMGIMQFDFSALENAEPKSKYILEIGNMNLNVASDNPSVKVMGEVSLYDMSNDIIWEDVTDESGNVTTKNNVSDGTLSKNVEGNIAGKTPIASFISDDWKGPTNGGDYIYLDISEFIKTCIETGNLTPSIGFRVKALIPEGYKNAPGYGYTRTTFQIGNNNATYLNIRCIDYVAPDLTCELESLTVGEENIDFEWIDSENTYYKYLPYGTDELPTVSATANDAATVEITQATMDSKEATVTVTNVNDISITKTYKVKYVISETESNSAKYDFYGNMLNFYSFKSDTDNGVRTYFGESDGKYAAGIYAGDIVGKRTNYAPYMGIIKIDLNDMKDADLSGDFILRIRYFANTVGEQADRSDENLKSEISFYDMTGDINWETDIADGTKSRDIEGNTAGKLPFGSFEYGNVTYPTDIYQEVDISEFIRKCIRENNLTPSIGVRQEMPELNEYTYPSAYGYARSSILIYCNGTNRLVINYKK